MEELKKQAGEVTGLVREGATVIKEQAAEAAEDWTRTAKASASQLVNERKRRVAGSMQSVSGAAHQGAKLLQAGKAQALAEYVDLAAQSVDRASKYLEDADLAEMTTDLADLVRRNAAVTVGALLLLGLVAGRVARIGNEVESRQRNQAAINTRRTRGRRGDEE